MASGDNRFDLDLLRNHHFCRSLSRSKLDLEALPDVHSLPVVSRFSSKGEVTLLQKLISKHGSDVEAMARDRRLNPEQRTEGELRRAIRRVGGDYQSSSANSGDRLAASKNSLFFGRRPNTAGPINYLND